MTRVNTMKKGFNTFELVVAIGVIVLVVAFAVPLYWTAELKANEYGAYVNARTVYESSRIAETAGYHTLADYFNNDNKLKTKFYGSRYGWLNKNKTEAYWIGPVTDPSRIYFAVYPGTTADVHEVTGQDVTAVLKSYDSYNTEQGAGEDTLYQQLNNAKQ